MGILTGITNARLRVERNRGTNQTFTQPMSNMNYYELLGITPIATPQEIRSAYFDRVNRYAMQMNASSRDFDYHRQQVVKAYQVLSDPEKRAEYDRTLPSK